MSEYLPPKIDWVRKHVELYEGSGGTEGTTLRETGLPCVIVTHQGRENWGYPKNPIDACQS